MYEIRRVIISRTWNYFKNKELASHLCKRGKTMILNRAGLKAASCECYRTEKEINGRFLSKKQKSEISQT